jgi:hypothetical protein
MRLPSSNNMIELARDVATAKYGEIDFPMSSAIVPRKKKKKTDSLSSKDTQKE